MEVAAVVFEEDGKGVIQESIDSGTPAICEMYLDHDLTVFPETPADGDVWLADFQDSPDLNLEDSSSGADGISDFVVDDGVGEFMEFDDFDTDIPDGTGGDSVVDSSDSAQTAESMEVGFVDGPDYLFPAAFS